MEKTMCELCEKRDAAYSTVRKMFICENCFEAIGRQEIRFDSALSQDLTGQDAERE